MPRLAFALSIVACAPSPAGTGDGGPGGTSGASGSTTEAGTSSGDGTTGQAPTTSGTGTATSGTSTSGEGSTGEATTGEPSVGSRYDEVRQKSSHNSFQRDEGLLDQMIYHRVRSLEFDIHVGKTLEPDLGGDWYVYHIDVVDADSQCRTLSQCLGLVATLGQVVPEHEVVTLWIDLKDGFGGEHQPGDLDARLVEAFGERLWTPGELLVKCPASGLQQAIARCGWPELAALRGRVIVALTGGDLDDANGALASYVGGDPAARAAFVAPGLEDAGAIAAHDEAIFHNLAVDDVALAQDVRAAGMVSRVWVVDDAEAWQGAVSVAAHHLATNKINAAVDPWGSTAGAGGWPFACLDGCEAPAAEPGAIVAFDVDSDDLWDSSDEGSFAYFEPQGDVAVTAAISVVSSHVEPWGKACVGARGGLDAGAPYLAVCRPTDEHPLRVQLREQQDGDTQAIEIAETDGLGVEVPALVRLVREGACVRGLGSVDGVAWKAIAEHCFAAPPAYVGLLASSHGGGEVRSLFVELEAVPGGAIEAGELTVVALGAGSGAVQNGLAP
jgi:hypothetical protein